MTPYSITQGHIKRPHMLLYQHVVNIVDTLPNGLNCHQICEEITQRQPHGQEPKLTHIKGQFNHWDHSWLAIVDTNIIIDPYPWATGSGPIIIDTQPGTPWATLYTTRKEKT